MDKLITRYLLPFLLVALVVALFLEFSSVERIELDSNYGQPVASSPRPLQPAPRQSLNNGRQASSPVTKSRLAAGQSYRSLDELVKDQLAAGFVRTGYFGKHWPARVSEIATDRNEIKFVRQNGTPHHYKGFGGYIMKMVRLKSGAKETIVVFRSVKKNR